MANINSIKTVISNIDFHERKKVAQKKERRFMTTEQLKQIFNQEAKCYYQLLNRAFTVDDENKNFLNLFCKYFANDETFETIHKGELRKGLFVYGNHGTGKTSSFKIIQNISKRYQLKDLWFPITETSKVVEKFNTEKNKDFIIKNYSKGKFCFDDFGAENEANNIFIYGKEDIFIRIMENRYNEFILKGTLTHMTSNLNLEEIKKRYGSRVEDRFVQMFNFISLDGNSKRF